MSYSVECLGGTLRVVDAEGNDVILLGPVSPDVRKAGELICELLWVARRGLAIRNHTPNWDKRDREHAWGEWEHVARETIEKVGAK